MKERGLILVLVAGLAVMIGVVLTAKQVNDQLLKRVIQQQSEILSLQRKLNQQLSGGLPDLETGDAAVNIQARLNALDKKVDGLTFAIKNLFSQKLAARDNAAPQRQAPPPEDYTKVYDIDVAHSVVRGKKDAPVTIVEFADFQCPFCTRFHPAVVDVLKEYPGKVNFILKNYPLSFHPNARPAAKAALAAGEQGKYHEYADLLLVHSRELSDEKYKEIAKELGLDVEKFWSDYKDKDAEWEKIIQADMALAQEVAVRGTPTFFINGKKTLARDLPAYKKEIDGILSGK